MIELLNCDCMEYMATVPDKYFDLAVVDVSYGIGENGDRNKSRGKLAIAKDYKAFSVKFGERCKQRHCFWLGTCHTAMRVRSVVKIERIL